MKRFSKVFKGIISVLIVVIITLISVFLIKDSVSNVFAKNNEYEKKNYLAYYYLKENNYDKSNEYFEEIIEVEEDNIDAKVGYVSSLILQKKYQKAEEEVYELVETYSDNADLQFLLGQLSKVQGDFNKAKDAFNKAKELSKENNEKYEEMILILNNIESGNLSSFDIEEKSEEEIKGFIDKKITDLDKAVGEDAEVYKRVAQFTVFIDNGQTYEVIEAYQTDTELGESIDIKILVAKAYIIESRIDESIALLEEILDSKRDNEAYRLLSEAYLKKIEYHNNSNINANNTELTNNEELIDFTKKAIKAIKKIDNKVECYEKLARLNFILGDNDKTKESLQELIVAAEKSNDSDTIKFYNNILLNSKDSSPENLNSTIEENLNFFHKLNSHMPSIYHSETPWEKYFINYFAFGMDKLTILDVNTDAYPMVTVSMRGNTTLTTEGKLDEKHLEIFDSGLEVDDFEVKKEEGAEVNVILLMDTSGSMNGESIVAAKEAAINFVDNMNENENIRFVAFSSGISHSTDFINANNKEYLKEEINRVYADGGTNIYGSIDECLEYYNSGGNNIIILMTDGQDGNIDGLNQSILNAKSKGVPVFSVGLGSSVGYNELQKLSSETGGEFFLANEGKQISELYEEIRLQFDNIYKISYKVQNEEQGHRNIRIINKKEDIYSIGRYTKPGVKEDEEKNIVFNEGKSTIYTDMNTEQKIKIDLSKHEIVGDISDVYIGDIYIDGKMWSIENEILTILIPKYIYRGEYDLYLWSNAGREYLLKEAINIREYKELTNYTIGELSILGEFNRDDLVNGIPINGDLTLNGMQFSGEIYLDIQNNILVCNGILIGEVNGKNLTLSRGWFELYTDTLQIRNSDICQTNYDNFKFYISGVDISEDKYTIYGDVEVLGIDSSIIRFGGIESLEISENGVRLVGKDFRLNTETLSINGEIVYENGKVKGNGIVSLRDSITNNRRFEEEVDFEFDIKNKVYEAQIEKVNIKLNNAMKVDVGESGIQVGIGEILVYNPGSEFQLNEYKGSSAYSNDVEGNEFKGEFIVHSSGVEFMKVEGTLINSNINLSLEGIMESEGNFYGSSEIKVLHDELGEFQGVGEVYIKSEEFYGIFDGVIPSYSNKSFEISNKYITFTDGEGNIITKALYGRDVIEEIKEEILLQGINTVEIHEKMEEIIIEVVWKDSKVKEDFNLISPEGIGINKENVVEHGGTYKSEEGVSSYTFQTLESGQWIIELDNRDIGDYEVRLLSRKASPNINLMEVVSSESENRIDLKWECTNYENSYINIYYYDEVNDEKKILQDNISARRYTDGITLGNINLVPGEYNIFVSISDGENTPKYSFVGEYIEVFNPYIPKTPKIDEVYRIAKNIIIKPNLSSDGIGNYRIYAVNNGEVDKINYYEMYVEEYIILKDFVSEGFVVSVIDYIGNESNSTDVVKVSEIKSEKELFELEFNPDLEKINVDSVGIQVSPDEKVRVEVSVNGQVIENNILEEQSLGVNLYEGGNEIYVTGNNDELDLYNRVLKVYRVDTKSPILNIESLSTSEIIDKKDISISGYTEPNGELLINESEVDVAEAGAFSYDMQLSFGKNLIEVESHDESGNVSKQTIMLKYYGNIKIYIIIFFMVLYLITILLFFIKCKRVIKNKDIKI